jgi:hypothetical protein
MDQAGGLIDTPAPEAMSCSTNPVAPRHPLRTEEDADKTEEKRGVFAMTTTDRALALRNLSAPYPAAPEQSRHLRRRILIRNDSSVAGLHHVLQIVMGWNDTHVQRFTLHSKEYGIARPGGIWLRDDPTRSASLTGMCDEKSASSMSMI